MGKKGRTISPFLKQCFVTTAVFLNCISMGNVTGFTAILFPQLNQTTALRLTTKQESWLLGMLSLFLLPGNFLAPLLADRWFGRRGAHAATSVTLLGAWFYTSLATSFTDLVIGRALHGLALGLFLPMRSVIVGEYSSPRKRGSFLTTISLGITFGIFAVHLVGSVLSWQQTALLCSFFPFAALVITMNIPESPSYLAAKGRNEECREAFHWLRGHDEDNELERLLEAVSKYTENETTGIKEVITMVARKEFYKPIVVVVHCIMLINFSGGPQLAAYATSILGELLGSTNNVVFWMLILDLQRLISNTLSVYVMGKFRRRTLLFWMLALCILSQISISVYLYTKAAESFTYQSVWLPVLLINVQYFTVGIGIVPVQNVIAGEVFPLQNRGVASSISVFFMATGGFVSLKFFPDLLSTFQLGGTFLIYSGILTYSFAVLWFILPETKGKTLQEIEDEFTGKPKVPVIHCKPDLDSRRFSTLSTYSGVHC